jgi:hypothetical protein
MSAPTSALFSHYLCIFGDAFLAQSEQESAPFGKVTSSLEPVAPANRRQFGIFGAGQPNRNVVSLKNQVLVAREVRRATVDVPDDEQTVTHALHPNMSVPRVWSVHFKCDIGGGPCMA